MLLLLGLRGLVEDQKYADDEYYIIRNKSCLEGGA